MGMTSEGPFQDYYLLVVSTQKVRMRRSEETTGFNSTRVGRMLVLRDQESQDLTYTMFSEHIESESNWVSSYEQYQGSQCGEVSEKMLTLVCKTE
jgi:hypothetical protein